jgi:hypothetical protein
MSWFRQLIALLISATLASTALAQEDADKAPPREDRPERAEMREKMLERFDADGDGELNDEERAKAREFRQERTRGGERGEGRRGREGRPPRGPDGRRGPEGRGPAGPPPGGPRGPGFPPNPERLFNAYDEDKNDQLSRDEFEKLMGKLRELGRPGPGRPPGPGGPPEFRRRGGGPDGPDREGRPPRPRGEGDRGPEGRRQRPPREEGAEKDEGRQSPEAEAAKADDATV